MRARFGKSRHAISLGLAFWLVFLSAFLYALHGHPGVRCDEKGTAGLRHSEQRDTPRFDSVYLSEFSEQDQPATRVAGLCPICLFLAKHVAERATAPSGPTPKDEASGRATWGPPILVTSLDRPSAAPRAPPC